MFLVFLILAGSSVAQGAGGVASRSYEDLLRSAYQRAARGDVDAARVELDDTELASRGFEWKHVNLAVELARADSAGLGPERGRSAGPAPSPRFRAISRLYGHGAACRALAVSPRGERIASGGDEQEIRIWNARTGDLERLLAGHSGAIVGLVFSKDGRRLVSGSADGNAIMWETEDGRATMTFRANGEALTAIAWSADNEWLATADATLGVRVWNASNSEARFVARGHTKPIRGLAFSPDGHHLASASEDGSVRVVDVQSGDSVRVFAGNGKSCRALAFESDNARISVAVADGSLRRLDLRRDDNREVSIRDGDPFYGVALSADGQRIATCSNQGAVRVFDSASKRLFTANISVLPLYAITFDAQTSRLFACGEDHVIYVLETDAELARTLRRANPGALPTDEEAAQMKPLEVDALCRRVLERPGLSAELYDRAANLAASMAERAPALGQIRSTVGCALYRQERFDEALASLTEAGLMRRGWPPNLAFRAMTLAKLGRLDEARAMLARLETLLREERWEADADARALLEEARAVVAASKPAPK